MLSELSSAQEKIENKSLFEGRNHVSFSLQMHFTRKSKTQWFPYLEKML